MALSALLALEDGTIFHGVAIGATGQSVGEVVFNTAITGYQEILTDPSYAQQIVTLTYPHIGNTGTNLEDEESIKPWVTGLVIRDLSLLASNYSHQQALQAYLVAHDVIGIANIDTRCLTQLLRDKGAQKGCLMAGEAIDDAQALSAARAFPGLVGVDLAKAVSTRECYPWREGSWQWPMGYTKASNRDFTYHVVAYDFGVKRNMLRLLVDRGCRLTVVPAQTPAQEVLALKPDGVFLSNGPGDPQACTYAIVAIQQLLAVDIPLFGICLGHQLLALAAGAKTLKMSFGHHGANHPVQYHDEQKGVWITSQNHGFVIDEASLPETIVVTHRSLFDKTVQGIAFQDRPAFGFQGHPEASPGPSDAEPLFDRFIQMMGARHNGFSASNGGSDCR